MYQNKPGEFVSWYWCLKDWVDHNRDQRIQHTKNFNYSWTLPFYINKNEIPGVVSCGKNFFYSEMVWYFITVYSIYNKENITGLLREIYFSSHCEKKYFPCVHCIHLWNILTTLKDKFCISVPPCNIFYLRNICFIHYWCQKGKEKKRVLVHTNLYYHPSSHSRVTVHLSDFCVTVMEI